MRLLRVTFIAIQVVAVVEAATVKWTLHKSCYRNREDTANDDALAQFIINSVNEAKSWASRGASKLDETVSIFASGKETKDLVTPLLGNTDYSTAAKDIRDKFKKISDLDGPVGKDVADPNKRYEKSDEWHGYENSESHYLNFIISCRPELVEVDNPDEYDAILNPQKQFDVLRKKYLIAGDVLKGFLDQEASNADWNSLPSPRTLALTQRDIPPPDKDAAGRLHVPEIITFHPVYINYLRSINYADWTQQIFNEATAPNALSTFKAKGDAKVPRVDVRPVDHLLEASFTSTMLHEFFHLSYFGSMFDDTTGAYRWAANVAKNNRENPDLLAIIGCVIELRNRDGQKYSVSAEGQVSTV